MDAARGYYSIIQYCPDASRAEGANVGVVLFCPDRAFLEVRMSKGNDRARRIFGGTSIDLDRLNAAKRSFANQLRSAGRAFRSPDDLDAFMRSRANDLLLIPSRPMKVREPKEELARLYSEMVGGRAQGESARNQFADLDALFRRPDLEPRIKFDQRVDVPILGRSLQIPYAYTNGKENLVLPKVFHGSEQTATSAGMKLALEGDLLRRHADKRLIIVARFDVQGEVNVLRPVEDLFREYELRLVLPTGLQQFVHEVEQQAH